MNITKTLMELGVAPGLAGYNYLKTAIKLVQEDATYLKGMTKRLYPEVARLNKSTASRVERGMRYAVEHSFDRMPIDIMTKYFGNTMDLNSGKVTNRHFLAALVEIGGEE